MNYRELKAAIARADIPNKVLANRLGLSEQAYYNKVSGRTEFKNSEIKKMAEMLDLSMESVNRIFFDSSVN